MIDANKEDFLKGEIWLLSFGAAFQRNSIYKPHVSDKDKKAFRKELRTYISNNILPLYKKTVDDKYHNACLVSIVDNSKYHKAILQHGQINIGTAQKLLNLVLKYYWCLGWIEEPPHFPVDRIIQKSLPAKSRRTWTKIYSIEDYMTVIDAARNQLKNGETLAQWELKNYSRN